MDVKVYTFDELIEQAKSDDNLRESLQRMRLQQLRMVQSCQAKLREQRDLMLYSARMPSGEITTELARECLTGAAHLIGMAAVALDERIELFREQLDKLGTPE